MPGTLDNLAAFAQETRFEDLPTAVVVEPAPVPA